MSGKIQRYNIGEFEDGMRKHTDGAWVTYDDHAAIVAAKDAEIAHYKTRLESLVETYGKSCVIAAATARREALEEAARVADAAATFEDQQFALLSNIDNRKDARSRAHEGRHIANLIRALIDAASSTGKGTKE